MGLKRRSRIETADTSAIKATSQAESKAESADASPGKVDSDSADPSLPTASQPSCVRNVVSGQFGMDEEQRALEAAAPSSPAVGESSSSLAADAQPSSVLEASS